MANIIVRNKGSLSSMTTLRAQEESKKRAQEEAERIETLGQASDLKAKPWILKEIKEKELKEKQALELAFTKLFSLRKDKTKYNQYLVSILIEYIKEEDISSKYKLKASWTKQGVVLDILDRNYQGAFKSCYMPEYDVFACKMLATKLGNTISRLEGYVTQTDTGILTPDKQELKIAMENYGRNH